MSNKRYITLEEVTVPKGVIVELTKKQAEALGDKISVPVVPGLRNDLNVEVDPEDKVLPQTEE